MTSTRAARIRRRMLVVLAVVWVAAAFGIIALRPAAAPGASSSAPPAPADAVTVTHWAVAELMDPELLPRFADEFNRGGHLTASGKPVVVTPVLVGSARQVDLLKARIGRGVALDPSVADPTLVTPKIDHWLS